MRVSRRDRCYVGEQIVAEGREVTADDIVERDGRRPESGLVDPARDADPQQRRVPAPRGGAAPPRRRACPTTRTRIAGRPVVVVAHGPDDEARAGGGSRRYLREQKPVVVGVGDGLADRSVAAGLSPDVVVLDARGRGARPPSAKALRAARDVVVRSRTAARPGRGTERFERHRRARRCSMRDHRHRRRRRAAARRRRAARRRSSGSACAAPLEEFLDRRPRRARQHAT